MTWAAWRRMRRAEARFVGPVATVAGVDEAGRGPLAGPVVAAAVVLDPSKDWEGIDDSKLLDAETRATLFARVRSEARAFAWSVVGQRSIERMNIRQASLTAMRRSVALLSIAPELVLVDGIDEIPGVMCPQRAVVDGDARMLSIAAASVLAKVVRDRIMERLDRVWPGYGFAQHKGYATPEHLHALRRLGPCKLHRFTFGSVAVMDLPFGDGAFESGAVEAPRRVAARATPEMASPDADVSAEIAVLTGADASAIDRAGDCC